MVITLLWVINRTENTYHAGICSQVEIRSYWSTDLDAIVELESRAFPVGPYSRRMLSAIFRNPLSFTFVADDGGKVVGYASVLPLDSSSADVESIAVDPDYQGKGIGGILLETIEKEMARRGYTRSVLEVRDKNEAAIVFYRRHGYEIISHMPRYYHELFGGSRGAYRMVKLLTTT